MEKIKSLILICFFIFAAACLINAQEMQTTDFVFYISIEDDVSDDLLDELSYFGRAFTAVETFRRYEDTSFKFNPITLDRQIGSQSADTPNVLTDVFASVIRTGQFRQPRHQESTGVHCRLDSDYYFHHPNRYLSSHWTMFSDKFNNDFSLAINTDGYLAIDLLNVDLTQNVSFFNVLWSYADETRMRFDDAAGAVARFNNYDMTFSGYGGYDIRRMSPLAGTFYSVRFMTFDTGGYIGTRDRMFDLGTKFRFSYEIMSLRINADFMTDFTARFRFQPDMSLQFSFSGATFSLFKQSDTFYSEQFVQIANIIGDYRFTKDVSSIAGLYFLTDYGRMSVEGVAVFYSIDEDFLALDERLTFISPDYFSQCTVHSAFDKFKLQFAGYFGGDFTPNVSIGTGVGVHDIDAMYVLMGFYCDFFAEQTFSDYRLAVRTEISTNISPHFSFYAKSYNSFYLNKLQFDFYIQCGFKSFF